MSVSKSLGEKRKNFSIFVAQLHQASSKMSCEHGDKHEECVHRCLKIRKVYKIPQVKAIPANGKIKRVRQVRGNICSRVPVRSQGNSTCKRQRETRAQNGPIASNRQQQAVEKQNCFLCLLQKV